MILSMSGQAKLFLLTIILGFFIGFIYDFFRISRKIIKHPNFLIQIEDIIYWLLVTLIVFYFLLNKTYGEVRAFLIFGVLMGMLLYFLTLSILIIKVSVAVIEIIKKVIITVVSIIWFPIKIILRAISIPLGFLKRFIKGLTNNLKKVLQKSNRYAKIKGKKVYKNLKIILNNK